MLGRSHVVLGAMATSVGLTAMGTDILTQPSLFITGLVFGTLASLLPDIDSQSNLIRKSFGVGSKQSRRELRRWRQKGPLRTIIDLLQWILARILDVVDYFLPHRGPTHYGITAILLTLFVYWVAQVRGWPDVSWIGFGIGYISHLVGDGVTKAGVKLLAPFYRRPIRLLPAKLCIRTGSWGESFLLTLMVIGLVASLFVMELARI